MMVDSKGKAQSTSPSNSAGKAPYKLTAHYRHLVSTTRYSSEENERSILREQGMKKATNSEALAPANTQDAPERKYVATAPNQIWSWGVAKYAGIADKEFCLFVCEDIYSRYVVGAKAYYVDTVESAVDFIDHVLQANNIGPSSGLVLHSSHGKVMQAEEMLSLLKERGVEVAPKRRGDKPYVSGLFSTLNRNLGLKSSVYVSFEAFAEAAEAVIDRYNNFFFHNQIGMVRPAERHAGKDVEIIAQRNKDHEQYRKEHPERFISGKFLVEVPAGPQYLNKADAE